MLAPGEYLTNPVAPEATREAAQPRVQAERTVEPPIAPPPAQAEEPEDTSFLMRLLRALGAIHT